MFKLKYTVPLLGLMLSIAMITFQYVSLSSELANRETRYAIETLRNTSNTLQGSLNDHLVHNDMVGVKQAISDVNFLPSARLVYLLNESDIVISSGQLELVGLKADRIEQAISPKVLSEVRSKMTGEIITTKYDATLLAVYPVWMSRKPGEFRPSRIGVVVVEFDLTAHLASLHASVLRSTSKSAFFILIFIILGGIGMRFLLTNRVSRILESAQEYMTGNRKVRVGLSGGDELASIAKAFDGVADSVEAAESEVLIRQESLNDAQRIAHLGNWEWEIVSGELFWSDEIFRIFGYKPKAFVATYEAFINTIHPDDKDLVQSTVGQALKSKSAYRIEHRIVRPNGEERVVLEVGELKLDEMGEPEKMTGTVLDITEAYAAEQEIKDLNASLERRVEDRTKALREEVKERKTAQDKYQKSEDRTRQIVNSAVDGIITINKQGIIESFNTAAEKIFGYSVIEVVGKNVSMLMPPSIAEHHDGYLLNYEKTHTPHIIGITREVQGQKKDGSTFHMELSVSEFTFGHDQTFVGIVRDITKRKEAESQLKATLEQLRNTQEGLVEAEKMASLGGLVAGVAHEINTPVGVGLTAATHLQEQTSELSLIFENGQMKKSDLQSFMNTAADSTKIVEANLHRASDLIKSFKQVAVDQTSEETRMINVLEYVDEVLQSLRPKLKQSQHEISVLGDRNIVINTSPGPLSQIITNLVMNSVIHAYDEGEVGHLSIEVKQNKNTVSLQYSDDGKGMNAEVRSKIFDPFFTTKRGSGGSGLGMHILYNQITQTLGGNVKCQSKLGQGTTFVIKIPIQSDEPVLGEVQ